MKINSDRKINCYDATTYGLKGFCSDHLDDAHQIFDKTKSIFGLLSRGFSYFALPWADKKAKAWMVKNQNPYLEEISNYAEQVNKSGVYALNLSYEWGCTSSVMTDGKDMYLFRILDWPFPGLGEHLFCVKQKASAGEYYNLTWPAVSPVIQAFAPGRFGACINQAPMRKHGRTLVGDWLKNRGLVYRETGYPPGHLLRKAFEEAKDYDEAKEMLSNEKICIPVIYLLSGVKPGQGCVIERTEHNTIIREIKSNDRIYAANRFYTDLKNEGKGWEPRPVECVKREKMISELSFEQLKILDKSIFKYPMISHMSRLILIANISNGEFKLSALEKNEVVGELSHNDL